MLRFPADSMRTFEWQVEVASTWSCVQEVKGEVTIDVGACWGIQKSKWASASEIAKLVQITPRISGLWMFLIRRYIVFMGFRNRFITGGPHIAWIYPRKNPRWYKMISHQFFAGLYLKHLDIQKWPFCWTRGFVWNFSTLSWPTSRLNILAPTGFNRINRSHRCVLPDVFADGLCSLQYKGGYIEFYMSTSHFYALWSTCHGLWYGLLSNDMW